MSHGKHKAKYMKHFFVKSFLISLVSLILVCICSAFTFDWQAALAERLYGMDSDDYAQILALTMGIWKILIVQFTLVPAIAAFFITKHIEKHHADENDDCGCGC